MKPIIRLLAIICTVFQLACHSSRKNINCDKFRTGKFLFHSKINNSYTIIERKDTLQIERDSASGNIVYAKIKWLNPCENELIYLKQSYNSSDTILAYVQKHPLITKILKAEKNYYIFVSSMEGVDMKLVDTLWVLKD